MHKKLSLSITILSPRRKIGWSSAITSLISVFIEFRDFNRNGRAFFRFRDDLIFALQDFYTLDDSVQPGFRVMQR